MKIKRIITYLLTVAMLLSTLTGCSLLDKFTKKKEDTTSATTITETSDSFSLAMDALAEYVIIRPDQTDEQTIAAASKLYGELVKKFGMGVTFTTDYLNKNEVIAETGKEILVGLTNRSESKGLRYLDYEIAYANDRIIINGGSGEAVAEAVEDFLENCVTEDGLTVPVSKLVSRTYPLDGLTVDGVLLSNFSVKEIAGDLDDTLREFLGKQVGIHSETLTGNEIILKTESRYGVTELDIYMDGGNLILANSTAIRDCSFVLEYFMDQIKNVQDGKITLAGNVSMTIDGYKTATTADIATLRAETDERIAEIRATENMSIPSGATVYYVSPNGSDSNDGKSPETAWQTLSKVNNARLSKGNYVCFERGGLWRGNLTAQAGVTYTAYGTGDKPVFYGSPENGADPTKWKKSGTKNIWYYVGSEKWGDVGTLVFNDGESCAIKAIREWKDTGDIYNWTTGQIFNNGYKDLTTDLHFYHDKANNGPIYLYSEENPGNRFESIEFNVKQNLIDVGGKNGVTIDNLCLKYTGSHGVGAGTVDDLTVQNCEFGWIGGSIQGIIDGRNYETRFGNAVEIYGGCTDYTVQNNYIYQIYDAGITHQYSGVGSKVYNHTNVLYLNNVIEYCVYSIEYFVSGCEPGNPSVMTNFRIEGNYMWYASRGFCEQRPPADRSWGAHIKGRCSKTGNRAKDYVIKDNVFVDGKDRLVQITSNLYNTDGSDSMPTFTGNIFVEEYGRKFGQIEQSDTPEVQIDAKFDFETAKYLIERTLNKSDSSNEFWFIQK